MVDDYSDRNAELGRLYPGHVETLCERHDRALNSSGAASLVIFSGSPKFAFLDDFQYPFKPNPHFLSWLPLPQLPHSYLVYTPGRKPVLIYCIPQDYWHPVPSRPDGYWTAYFDIRIVADVGEAGTHLPKDRDKCILVGEIDDAECVIGIVNLADQDTLVAILRQVRPGLRCVGHDANVKIRGPVAVGPGRHRMPVVVRNAVNQHRLLSRRIDEV